MEAGLRERLLAARKRARQAADGVRYAGSCEELHQHLRAYVFAKYLLEESPEDNLAELTAVSIANALRMDRSLMEEVDNAAECTGSTSAMRKRVLLLMAMQKDFGVELDPAATARAETLADLAKLIYDTRAAQGGQEV